MGIFSGLMGNASEIDTKEIESEVGPLLYDSEQITKAFKLIRDFQKALANSIAR